ncbi:hypothetical protein F2Q68_00022573 [Brassica cretica]|uniref:Uncharacterized protein n=1 Tax=Brassica cretica TaxID=69181 RepID=A0A8S9FY42_BRACR|nr:hypothetical protein F2Q68_00022573 [Brassica cretica]
MSSDIVCTWSRSEPLLSTTLYFGNGLYEFSLYTTRKQGDSDGRNRQKFVGIDRFRRISDEPIVENRTTKRTSNGCELERAGVEVARADRCRYQKHLRAEADRMNTSWNACKNRLGFKVAG